MATLESGTLLGNYEILVPIGAGGMGEVYRARDTRLKRDVAIKSLPAAFAQDPDRVARFQREAQVLASLNHPNIAAIYDVQELHSSQFLVMELVEGETLGERLARGPLHIDEAREFAKQIALALEDAHEKGILHRDLKPANIKVTHNGRVKVLDFGLAKLLESSSGDGVGLSNSPTMLSGTLGGAILGTASYMSPEQARGQQVDRTSDVWAFGCVLYEMLSGRQAFDGESVSDILGSVLKVEPDWNALPADTPPGLRKLLRRCLQKDRKRRLRDVADARIEIEEMGLEPSLPPRRGLRLAWVLAASGFLVAIALGFALYPRPSEEPGWVSGVLPPEGAAFASGIGGTESWASPALSPDGRNLAFTARDASQEVLLWIRPMNTLTPRSFPGTEDVGAPFWSPDSLSVGFFARGKLKKVDIASGLVQELADVQLAPRGGTWNRDGMILFAPSPGSPIYRISSVPGSKPVVVTQFAKGQTSHRSPVFLPDGRHFLFYALGSAEVAGLHVGNLDSTDVKRLRVNTDSGALYSPSGHLLFLRQGILLRQPFNVSTLEVAGDPVSVAEQVASFGNLISFAVSDRGDLAYWSLESAREHSQLMWVDRSGKPIAALGGPPGNYMGIDLSRDGKVLVHRHEAGVGNIVMFEGSNRPMKMLTNEASQHNSNPVLSADGTQFIFQSLRDSKWSIYSKRLDGIGDVRLLYSSEYIIAPLAWSRDGKFIIFWSFKAGSTDLWILDTTVGKEPELFARSASFAQFSPVGDWVAYSSETDGRNEVYIRRPTTTEGMQQISVGGGSSPRWGQDGKELFYFATGRRKLVSVKVNTLDPVIDYDPPIDLFDIESAVGDNSGPAHWYAVSPNGQQFLVVRTPAGASPIIAIQNWTASLNQ